MLVKHSVFPFQPSHTILNNIVKLFGTLSLPKLYRKVIHLAVKFTHCIGKDL